MAELPERLCAGSASFLADLAFVPNDVIESSDKESAMHPRQMRQERFFGRTRTIRFRVHPHPDFHRARAELRCSDLLGNTRNTRANANCHTWQDASVRPRRLFHRHYVGSKGKLATCESIPSDNSHYDLELKTPQAHVSGSNPPSVSMPGQDRCRFFAVCGSAWFQADRIQNPTRRKSHGCPLPVLSTALLSTALLSRGEAAWRYGNVQSLGVFGGRHQCPDCGK
jgi:hypothetical protein